MYLGNVFRLTFLGRWRIIRNRTLWDTCHIAMNGAVREVGRQLVSSIKKKQRSRSAV